MKAKLYIETTIPSYLVARPSRDLRLAADQQSTRDWWENSRLAFELFVSEVVLREAERGEPTMAKARLQLLTGLEILPFTHIAEELMARLLREEILPPNAADDAAHVAIAASHSMEFVLTWNCAHINNPYSLRRIERACSALSLECPVICTPSQLIDLYP